MTVLELRDAIETKLRDTNNQILSDAQYLVLLNEAQEEWVQATNELIRLDGYAAVAKQFDYTGPTDIIKLRQGFWIPLRGAELDVVNQYEWSYYGGQDVPPANYPRCIMQDEENPGFRIKVWPPPTVSSASTTLNGAITSSDTTIVLTSATNFRSPLGYILIGTEKILYQNVSGSSLLLCRRGVMGSTAASHNNLDPVSQLDILISYSHRPAALTGDSSVPQLHPSAHKDLEFYVMMHAMVLDGRPNEAAKYEQLWESAKLKAKKDAWRIQAASPAKRIGSPYGP